MDEAGNWVAAVVQGPVDPIASVGLQGARNMYFACLNAADGEAGGEAGPPEGAAGPGMAARGVANSCAKSLSFLEATVSGRKTRRKKKIHDAPPFMTSNFTTYLQVQLAHCTLPGTSKYCKLQAENLPIR
jgi:hypothetical protein